MREDEAHMKNAINDAISTSNIAVNTKKYYTVRCGYHPRLSRSCYECEREVKGFMNSEFRSFKQLGEAERYLRSISFDSARFYLLIYQ